MDEDPFVRGLVVVHRQDLSDALTFRAMTISGPLPVLAFSHVCIGVSDVDRSLGFYRDVLGMDVVFDVELEGESVEQVTMGAGSKGRMVGGLVGGVMVELISFGPGRRPKAAS